MIVYCHIVYYHDTGSITGSLGSRTCLEPVGRIYSCSLAEDHIAGGVSANSDTHGLRPGAFYPMLRACSPPVEHFTTELGNSPFIIDANVGLTLQVHVRMDW